MTKLLNPFSDLNQPNSVIDSSDNPYVSPSDTRKGLWDHSLFWAFVRVVCKGFMILVFVDALLFCRYWDTVAKTFRGETSVSVLVENFLTGKSIHKNDWKDSL